jgi:hypothetical protein
MVPMSDRLQVSRSLRWKWRLDVVLDHWRLLLDRMYGWSRR